MKGGDENIHELTSEERRNLLKGKITPEERRREQKKQVIYFMIYHICTFLTILIGFVMIWIWGPKNKGVVYYAFFLGILSAVVVFVQFTPQIYITYKLKVFILKIYYLYYT